MKTLAVSIMLFILILELTSCAPQCSGRYRKSGRNKMRSKACVTKAGWMAKKGITQERPCFWSGGQMVTSSKIHLMYLRVIYTLVTEASENRPSFSMKVLIPFLFCPEMLPEQVQEVSATGSLRLCKLCLWLLQCVDYSAGTRHKHQPTNRYLNIGTNCSY